MQCLFISRPRYQAEFWKRGLHVNYTESLFTVLSYSIFSVLPVLGGGGTHLLGVKKSDFGVSQGVHS